MAELFRIVEGNAPQIADWFRTRGGICIWRSINLSNIGASWTTPLVGPDGQQPGRPNWQAEPAPSLIITDPAEVVVDTPLEVKRFHVAVRPGAQGLMLKLTDASSARLRREVEKAGEGAWHEFDYMTQEAVIFQPAGKSVPLTEWMVTHDRQH